MTRGLMLQPFFAWLNSTNVSPLRGSISIPSLQRVSFYILSLKTMVPNRHGLLTLSSPTSYIEVERWRARPEDERWLGKPGDAREKRDGGR